MAITSDDIACGTKFFVDVIPEPPHRGGEQTPPTTLALSRDRTRIARL
jgi:hypothetical protein